MRCSTHCRLIGWRLPLAAVVCAAVCLTIPRVAFAADATASIAVHAQVAGRTSLTVSTQSLQFDVVNPAEAAVASVDFSAAARTNGDADVVLSVGLARGIDEGDGLSATGSSLIFSGAGDGTLSGVLGATGSSVAARWTGSGRRTGRLLFVLRARAAGSYAVPVRFVLTAP
jgi:hypothetical protein